MEFVGYIIGTILATGIFTRLTNKYIFRSFSYIKKAFFSFILISVLCFFGEMYQGIIGTVFWLVYDLIKGMKNGQTDKK